MINSATGEIVEGTSMNRMKLAEWKAEAVKRFGEDIKKWKFKCPNCGHIQTFEDFEKAGIEEPKNKFYYSCISRWTDETDCSWTLGGLFQIHSTEVLSDEGKYIPVFEFADEAEEKSDE